MEVFGDARRDIVIHNTNVKRWMYENYVKLAMMMGYRIRIVELACKEMDDVRLCMDRGQHNVPMEIVAKMAVEMEDDPRSERIFISTVAVSRKQKVSGIEEAS